MKFIKIIILGFLFCFNASFFSQNKIDSLKSVLKNTIESNKKATILMLLVDNYFNSNKDSAEFFIKETLQLTEGKKDLKQTNIHAALKYAQLYIVKGDYKKSQEKYDVAWSKMKNDYDYFLYNKYYGDLGVLSFYKGDFKGALENFNKALVLAKKEKNEVDQLRFLNNKALAMSYLGEAESSLDVHEEAIKLAEKLNDSTALGKSFNNIGLIYEDMKEYEKALEFYLQALEIKKNGKSQIDVANGLYNVAGMYKEIGEEKKDTFYYKKAENYYEQSLAIAEKINYGKVILFNKTGIAKLASARNKPKKAIEIYKSVIADAEKANDQESLRTIYLNLGVNYLIINNLNEAEKNFLKALPLIEFAKKTSEKATLYQNLATLYSQKKQFEKAFEFLLKQNELEQELSKNSLQEKISNFEIKYETANKEKEIAQQKEQLLEKELAIKNRNLYAILLAFALLISGIIFFGLFKKNQFKRKQLQKEIDLKDALAIIKTQNRLQEQRLRISRDLHDNIGSQLTFIISSLDNLNYLSKETNSKLKDKLTDISSFTSETIHQLRDTIWAMNKNEISLDDLHARTLSFIEKAKAATENIEFEVRQNVNKNMALTSIKGMNIFRVIQEAINNSIKYANASKITVSFDEKNENLLVAILDDGIGFDFNTVDLGNGLSNMEKRMNEIGGTVLIKSELKKGTAINLKIIQENKANDV